jgi:hypothetical protein
MVSRGLLTIARRAFHLLFRLWVCCYFPKRPKQVFLSAKRLVRSLAVNRCTDVELILIAIYVYLYCGFHVGLRGSVSASWMGF